MSAGTIRDLLPVRSGIRPRVEEMRGSVPDRPCPHGAAPAGHRRAAGAAPPARASRARTDAAPRRAVPNSTARWDGGGDAKTRRLLANYARCTECSCARAAWHAIDPKHPVESVDALVRGPTIAAIFAEPLIDLRDDASEARDG